MVELKDVAIRDMTRDDVAAGLTFINRLVDEDALIGQNEPMTIEDEQKFVDETIDQVDGGNCIALVAEHHGKIVGSAQGRRGTLRQKHLGVLAVAIDKDYRGIGLGEKILKMTIERTAKLQGITLLDLCSFSPNTPAIALYRKLGFEEVARIPDSYMVKGKPVDMIVMHRKV